MPARISHASSSSSIVTSSNDHSMQQFTGTAFDPVSFLNDALPSLTPSATLTADQAPSKKSSLQELSTQTQTFLGKVNAQKTRFASTLSQLTDEILRTGSRLAYEVEVLRGDANVLHESLTEYLQQDIHRFTLADTAADGKDDNVSEEKPGKGADALEPEFISQLRMLGQVKVRLEEVINVFGEAMKWSLPPSEISLASSLISVSAPEPGSENDSREEKGKEFARRTKAEILGLLNKSTGGPDLEAAVTKVGALRSLSMVWKGTAEERARNKLVESLSKLVDEKKRQLEARAVSQPIRSPDAAAPRSSSTAGRSTGGQARDRPGNENGGGGGLFRNLQRLRDEIYLD